MSLEAITYEKTDELRNELRGYDQEAELMDGLTAAASLKRVINVAKLPEPATIVYSGSETARAVAMGQETLF